MTQAAQPEDGAGTGTPQDGGPAEGGTRVPAPRPAGGTVYGGTAAAEPSSPPPTPPMPPTTPGRATIPAPPRLGGPAGRASVPFQAGPGRASVPAQPQPPVREVSPTSAPELPAPADPQPAPPPPASPAKDGRVFGPAGSAAVAPP
ncbi:MAG: hypothetical protein ABW046_06045, partial [Actinoplanes sp.]